MQHTLVTDAHRRADRAEQVLAAQASWDGQALDDSDPQDAGFNSHAPTHHASSSPAIGLSRLAQEGRRGQPMHMGPHTSPSRCGRKQPGMDTLTTQHVQKSEAGCLKNSMTMSTRLDGWQ